MTKVTREEIEYVESNWLNKTNLEIAQLLTISERRVKHIKEKYGFKRNKLPCNHYYTYGEVSKIFLCNVKGTTIGFTSVDTNNLDKLLKLGTWCKHHKGYAYCSNENLFMHRTIMNCADNQMTDHIDRDRLNNLESNLRPCTNMENQQNVSLHSRNISGYKNVKWNARDGKWQVMLSYDNKRIFLGNFTSIGEADEVAKFGRAYTYNFSKDKESTSQKDIPQWIINKIITRLAV